MTDKAVLTRNEAVAYLHISKTTFDRNVKAGRIPCWVDQDTGWKRYPKAALDAWLVSFANDVAS